MSISCQTIRIDRLTNEAILPIEGLTFQKNTTTQTENILKVPSSPGPLISDFVTHEQGFQYTSYGIHVGQVDRLTFLGPSDRTITGYFVDCRENSPTLHHKIILYYSPSNLRRLTIPTGVAHSFDGLEGIVTRDEPVWYSDENNKDWNVDNDLITVSRETEQEQFPTVKVNRFLMPEKGHLLVSKMQQSLLKSAKSYSLREKIKINSNEVYVTYRPNNWEDVNAQTIFGEAPNIKNVDFKKNSYALTGENSITLVPSFTHGVSDILVVNSTNSTRYTLHMRTAPTYTFLAPENQEILIELVDLRENKSNREKVSFSLITNPRFSLRIPNGVCYRFTGIESLYLRLEHEFYADENEPRDDIPNFGSDLSLLDEEETLDYRQIEPPSLRCPDSLTRKLANFESNTST